MYTHSYMNTHSCKYTHLYKYAHICIYMDTHICTYMHTYPKSTNGKKIVSESLHVVQSREILVHLV